ncbi:Alpha-xylosidase [Hordeum vulgare]|nr:Alpha-xylosidase [Hordeum vulgare]
MATAATMLAAALLILHLAPMATATSKPAAAVMAGTVSRVDLLWGYHNVLVVEDVLENYRRAQIPLDMIWNDDDHMDARKDFTLSPVNYPRPKLPAFLNML